MRTTDEKWPEGLSHCEVCFLGQSSLYPLPIIARRKPEVSDKSPSQNSVHLENPLRPQFALARQKFGMLGVTGFGLLFTPVFYTFVRKWGRSNTIGFQQQQRLRSGLAID